MSDDDHGPRAVSGARFLAETIDGYGVTTVFFVESTLRQTLIELEALGVRRVGARSEKGAAYMADGFARVSGRPSVCMCQSVGAANMAAGLQDAYLGRSPVISLTGKKPLTAQDRNAYQEIDHGPLFGPVTKFHAAVDDTARLPVLIRQAFREATTGSPRPVHLDIGGGWGGQGVESGMTTAGVVADPCFSRCPAVRPEPDRAQVLEAVKAITAAERPVIVAGGGARISGAGQEIGRLAELRNIPVTTSLNGKGVIPGSHPLNIGVVGSYSRPCANRVVAAADLVVFVGSATGDQVTNDWRVPPLSTRAIQIDIDPAELGRNYPDTIPLAGDAKAVLAAILRELGPLEAHSWADECRALRAAWFSEVESLRNSDASPIRVERLCREIEAELPPDGVLVSDTGFSGMWTGAMISLRHPDQIYLRAAGSLGWALPAGLGAKCATPERPVVCFTGDAGFLYHMAELETARRCGIPTVTVVNNNHGYGQCTDGVLQAYGGRPGRPEELYGLSELDFSAVARAMGCEGIRVVEPRDIAPAIRQAIKNDAPTVVDVVTDVNCRAPAAWPPA